MSEYRPEIVVSRPEACAILRLAGDCHVIGVPGPLSDTERFYAETQRILGDLAQPFQDGGTHLVVNERPTPANCHKTRGWHGRADADGRCVDCGTKLPPGPPDSPLPPLPNVS